MSKDRIEPGTHIVFYDGVCGFCNATVRFIAARDTGGSFLFAPQQGEFAASKLRRWGRDPNGLGTMYVLLDFDLPTEKLIFNSDAVLTTLRILGGVWKLSAVARLLPLSWRDRLYGVIIHNRYRIFGKYDQCPLPPPALRARFIEDDAAPPPAMSDARTG